MRAIKNFQEEMGRGIASIKDVCDTLLELVEAVKTLEEELKVAKEIIAQILKDVERVKGPGI